MADMGSFLPPIVAELKADISEFSTKMGEARGQVAKLADSASSNTEALAAIGKTAFFAFGAAAVAGFVMSMHAADEFEAAHARLETAIKNSGATYEQYAKSVDHVDSKMEALGFTNSDTENSLSRLVTASGNVTKAESLMGLAADISRARHMDLESATNLLVKVEGGRYALLGRMLGLSQQQVSSITSEHDAVALLSRLYGGEASSYADTFSGKMQVLSAQVEDAAKNIGMALVPMLSDLLGGLEDVFGFLGDHVGLVETLAIAIGVLLTPAIGLWLAKDIKGWFNTAREGWLELRSIVEQFTGFITRSNTALDANTAATQENTAAQAENAGATESRDGALAAEAEAEAGATAATEEHTAALAGQMSMLDANGAALDFGGGQLALFDANALGATESTAGLTEAAGGLTLGLGATTAIVGGLALGAYMLAGALDSGPSASFKKAQNAADQWSAHTISAAQASTNAVGYLTTKLHEQEAVLSRLHSQAKEGQLGGAAMQLTAEGNSAWAGSNAQADAATRKIEALKSALDKARESSKSTATEAGHLGNVLGVNVPHGADTSVADLKLLEKEINVADAAFGQQSTDAMVAAGVTGSALKNTLAAAQNFGNTISSSIQKATDPFSKFGTQTEVSEQQLEQFFVGSNQQAGAWADEIKSLIGRGVDQGIVDEMAKAGPNSKPALDAFVQMVDLHGVQWVNDMAHSSDAAQSAVDSAYNTMAVQAAIKSAEMAQVTKAAMADMKTGGISHLSALVASSNSDMANMAQTAISYISQTQRSIDGVHGTDVHINIFANDYASGVIGAVNADLAGLAQYGQSVAGQIAALDMIPHAAGGVFTSPHVGLVAEAGPEAILPLDDPQRSFEILAQSGLLGRMTGTANTTAGSTLAGGGDVNVTIQNHGVTADSEIARRTARETAWAVKTLR